MLEVYDIARARKALRRREPLPLPKSLLGAAEVFGFDIPATFDLFCLRRCKEGTTVFVKGGRLTLNLSAALKTYPANFKAARQWITAIADRYGWNILETKKYL